MTTVPALSISENSSSPSGSLAAERLQRIAEHDQAVAAGLVVIIDLLELGLNMPHVALPAVQLMRFVSLGLRIDGGHGQRMVGEVRRSRAGYGHRFPGRAGSRA